MDPVSAILWIGVSVFAATSLLAVLYLAGFVPNLRQEHGQHLFRILIAEIVLVSVAVFTYVIKTKMNTDKDLQLPVKDLMVLEQNDAPLVVHDSSTAIYIRSPDVSRARRVTDLQLDTREDFSTASSISMEVGTPIAVSVSGKTYLVSCSRMGTFDPNPKEKQGKSRDFVMLSIDIRE